MIGIGTIVNAIAIIAGAAAGSLIRGGLPERIKSIIMQGVGLAVLFIGLSGALQGLFIVAGNGLERQYVMLMIASMVIGGIAGELLQIEAGLEKAGQWFEEICPFGEYLCPGFRHRQPGLLCRGMAIVGALEDGLAGNATTLFSNPFWTGHRCHLYRRDGDGGGLSALPVLNYQGGITLLAGVLRPFSPQP